MPVKPAKRDLKLSQPYRAWREDQYYIIFAQSFYEPDWRSGKAISTRIARVDGKAKGTAGLCAYNEVLNQFSFTKLAMSADDQPLMCNFSDLKMRNAS